MAFEKETGDYGTVFYLFFFLFFLFLAFYTFIFSFFG